MEEFYMTPRMEESLNNIDRLMRETQDKMKTMMAAMQASIADLQNRNSGRLKSRSHHRISHHQHTQHSTSSEELEEQRRRRRTEERSKTRSLPLNDKQGSSHRSSHRSSHHHSQNSSPAISSRPRKTRVREKSSSTLDYSFSSHVSSSRTNRYLPLPDKHSPSPSLISSQKESQKVNHSSQQRRASLISHASPLSTQVIPSAINFHNKTTLSKEEFSGSLVVSPDVGHPAQDFLQSIKKTKMELDESIIKKINKENEIEEQRQVDQWSDYVYPNLATEAELIPRQVSIVDLLTHPCSSEIRVLRASKIGVRKIKDISENKNVLVKSQQPQKAKEMVSGYSGVQDAEWQPWVESLLGYSKLDLQNPIKAPESYLTRGDLSAKTALFFPDVFDFFTRFLQRMALKNYQLDLGEVVAPIFLEIIYSGQVHFLARFSATSGSYVGQNSTGPLEIVTPFKIALDIPAFQLMGVLLKETKHVLKETSGYAG